MSELERWRRIRRSAILSLFLGAAAVAWGVPATTPKISYTVDVRRPADHLINVGISVDRVMGPTLDLAIPAWLPGYNKVQDFARNVQEFMAEDGSGRPLPWSKTDKQTWRIVTRGAPNIRVSYRVFADNRLNLNVAAHADDTHAFFNGAAVFCYIPGFTGRPVSLRILKPDGWEIATGLEPAAEEGCFRAGSYDELVDCPTEIGAFVSFAFHAAGKPHRIAIYGLKDFDASFIVPDIARIVEACAGLFGGLPYRDYTFIYHLVDRERRSGVEHANSTAIIFNRRDFHARRHYDEFLNLTAHEYLHLWNIKRIRPLGWGPFDYSREAYTTSHWFTEGITSYYSGLILVRAGLWTPAQFYEDMAAHFSSHERSGGRDLMSLEEASWNNWLKPDNAPETTVSYYEKGAVVGWMLDLEIRKRSGGDRSLDDVMRELDRTFGASGTAYGGEDLLRAIREISGSDFSDFYAAYVAGRGSLPLDSFLRPIGLELACIEDPPEADLGIAVDRAPGDGVRIIHVRPGGPGSEAALDTGDIVLALNGERVRFDDWPVLLGRQKIGGAVRLDLYHLDDLISRTVPVREARRTRYLIREAVGATPESAARRNSLFTPGPTGRITPETHER